MTKLVKLMKIKEKSKGKNIDSSIAKQRQLIESVQIQIQRIQN